MPTPGTLANGLPAGIGTPDEAMQATAWVRQQPWYQDFLKQYGVREGPNQQVTLNDTQRAALMATMIQHGIGLNSKFDMVDENGIINEEHHKVKKVAIAAAIAGLAVTGLGAAGIGPLAGALGGASAAGAAGGAASAAALEGGATAGIASATALGLPVTAGLGTAGAIGAGAAGAGAAGIGAGLGGTEAAAAPLASSTIGTGAIGPLSGSTSSLAGGGAAAAGAGLPGSSGYAAGLNQAGGSIGAGGETAASSTPSWVSALKTGGQIASDISSGRAQGRAAESNINNNADRTALDLYRTQIGANTDENNYGLNASNAANSYGLSSVNAGLGIGNLDLAQKDYALAAPGKRAGNAVRGDILANAQDVSIDQPNIPKTTISGGLRPSMFSANTRELGGLLSSQALAQQKAGDTFAPLPKVPAYQPPPAYKPPPAAPTLTGPSQANGFDTGLNAVGYASLGADLLAKYGKYFA